MMLVIATLLFIQQSNHAVDWKAYNKWHIALGITAVGAAATGLGYLIYLHGKIHSLENNFNIIKTRAATEGRKIQQTITKFEKAAGPDSTDEELGRRLIKTTRGNSYSLEELCNLLSGRPSKNPDRSEGGDALML